ncbi:unnamed protein product, partial [Prorocentrum cordatum]
TALKGEPRPEAKGVSGPKALTSPDPPWGCALNCGVLGLPRNPAPGPAPPPAAGAQADSAGVLSDRARQEAPHNGRQVPGGRNEEHLRPRREGGEVFLAVHGVSGSGVESFGPFVQAFAQAAMDRRGGSSAGIMLSCWRSEASWGGGEPPADGIPVDGILGVLVGEQSPRRRRGHPEAHETEVTVTFIMEDKAKSSSELVLTFATAEVAEESGRPTCPPWSTTSRGTPETPEVLRPSSALYSGPTSALRGGAELELAEGRLGPRQR